MASTPKDNPKSVAKPRLKNLDDLFQLDDGGTQSGTRRSVISLEVDKLAPFKGHPFSLYEGERLADMVESVRTNGVLVPIIVRRIEGVYEILSGHNRVNAAKLAGLDEVSALVLEGISDDEAMVYVVETNLIQRSFTDMTHSEKAAVIALHHSKMFSQGKRNDILEQLKTLENPHGNRENGTSTQLGKKLTTIEKVGENYSLSKNTIARYLRVNQLIPALKSQLDSGHLAFIPAVTLSFLKEAEQSVLDDCMSRHNFTVDMKKADMLRDFSEKGKLNSDSIFQILSGEPVRKPKSIQSPTVKISKTAYARYFNPSQSAKEVQEIVEKALEMYFEHH